LSLAGGVLDVVLADLPRSRGGRRRAHLARRGRLRPAPRFRAIECRERPADPDRAAASTRR